MSDPYELQRFIDAQEEVFDVALHEIRAGAKQSHWMWFVFPQLSGLGHSPAARFYAIGSADEARAYLAHPLLGSRLSQCLSALLQWQGKRTPEQILGAIDSMKLRSCLTLFEAASLDPRFGQAIDALFHGERDERTLALLEPTS